MENLCPNLIPYHPILLYDNDNWFPFFLNALHYMLTILIVLVCVVSEIFPLICNLDFFFHLILFLLLLFFM